MVKESSRVNGCRTFESDLASDAATTKLCHHTKFTATNVASNSNQHARLNDIIIPRSR